MPYFWYHNRNPLHLILTTTLSYGLLYPFSGWQKTKNRLSVGCQIPQDQKPRS